MTDEFFFFSLSTEGPTFGNRNILSNEILFYSGLKGAPPLRCVYQYITKF